MADLRSLLWHFRKKVALAVLVCCSLYAIYVLQNCCSQTGHSRSRADSTRRISQLAGNKISGNFSGITNRPTSSPFVVRQKGKLISRTLEGLKEGKLTAEKQGHEGYNVFRTKNHNVFNDSSSSFSSDQDEEESSEYISSSSLDDGKVEDDNILEKPALLEPQAHYRAQLKTNEQTKLTKKLPTALIIGVKKGGTRALLEFIRLHPDVKAAGAEVHFFDKYYDNGLNWYRRQMPPTLEGQLTLEKTPGYFPNPDVPKRIYEMNKDIKLIVIFRDPVSRVISDYAQSLTKGKKKEPLEELVMLDYDKGMIDSEWSPVKISLYANHLRNWLPFFPLKQFLFLNGENLVKNPAEELIKVQKFLGIDVVIDANYFYFNKTKGFPCLKKGETKQDPKCLGESKGRPHPKVEPYVIKALQRFFRPYNERLYKMIGVNFHWEDKTSAKL